MSDDCRFSRVQDLLARHPRPTAPAQQPWEISASSVISPFLPGSLPVPTTLVDRLGRIHLSPLGLAIDQKKTVPWQQVRQIHTRPAFEVVSEALIARAIARATFLLPPVPGRAWSMDLIAEKGREAVMSILQVALSGASPSLLFDIPVAVVFTTGRRSRQDEMAPGVLSTAFLALPGVSEAILHTATLCAVPVIRHPARTLAGADRAAQRINARLRSLTNGSPQAPAAPERPSRPDATARPDGPVTPRRRREYTG